MSEAIKIPGSADLLNARKGRNSQYSDVLDEVVRLGGILDSPLNDAFGRVRISNPTSVFDAQLQYDKGPLLFYEKTAGSGSSTHLADEAAVRMDCTTASGDSIIRQSKQYHRYQPGKSQLVLVTFDFGSSVSNVRKRVGYFDDENGFFFEDDGGTINIVKRSNVTGSVVETDVGQSSWNLDVLDGTGLSEFTLDATKSQIFFIDLEWLGVGRVRCGFVIDGVLCYAHQFTHANEASSTYITTANLPVRYEMTNTDTAGSAPSMRQICASVISEGGFEEDRGLPRCTGNGATLRALTTRAPLAAIRPAATFNSIVNRAQIVPTQIDAYSEDQAVYVEVVYEPASVTGGSWSSVTDSVVEVNTTLTAITGGTPIAAFYVSAGGAGGSARPGEGAFNNLLSKLPLTLDIDGANPIVLVIMATSIPGSSTDVSASLFWREQR